MAKAKEYCVVITQEDECGGVKTQKIEIGDKSLKKELVKFLLREIEIMCDK